MPGSAWTAVAGKALYMAVAVSRTGNSFDLDIYIDGVHLWHNAFTNSTYMSDTNVEFWWGNDRRQDASICTKGTLHSLKVYNKHLSNYDVLKSMREDMERYG
jgi:hypothetical protein